MYRIDVRNLVKSKLFICRDYHIQPSEIERMPYYEFEYMLEDITEITKQQQKQQEEQEKEYAQQQKAYNPKTMMSSMQQSMPKISMPSMPTISMPKL